MKRTTFALLLCALVTSCGYRDPRTVHPVSQSIGSVVDAGVVDLPNKPGYKLRSYVVLTEGMNTHYVYAIEKDGVPVAGTSATYKAGKVDIHTTVTVDGRVVPSADSPK